MLVVVVFMSVTSVLVCRRILPRFCSGEFFTYNSRLLLIEQHYTLSDGKHNNITHERHLSALYCRKASILILVRTKVTHIIIIMLAFRQCSI